MSVLLDEDCCCGPCHRNALSDFANAKWRVDIEAFCECVALPVLSAPPLPRIKLDLEYYQSGNLFTTFEAAFNGESEGYYYNAVDDQNYYACPPASWASYRKQTEDGLLEVVMTVSPYPTILRMCQSTPISRSLPGLSADMPIRGDGGNASYVSADIPVWACAKIEATLDSGVYGTGSGAPNLNAVTYRWFLRKIDKDGDWNFLKPNPPSWLLPNDPLINWQSEGRVHLAVRLPAGG